jgi:hypothetical protein
LYVIFVLDEPKYALEIAEILRLKENKKVIILFESMKKCISKINVVFCGKSERENIFVNIF